MNFFISSWSEKGHEPSRAENPSARLGLITTNYLLRGYLLEDTWRLCRTHRKHIGFLNLIWVKIQSRSTLYWFSRLFPFILSNKNFRNVWILDQINEIQISCHNIFINSNELEQIWVCKFIVVIFVLTPKPVFSLYLL